MTSPIDFDPSRSIKTLPGTAHRYHSLPETAALFGIKLDELPFSLRPILEGIARNVGQNGVTAEQILALGNWTEHQGTQPVEIPFTAGRVIMHDLSGTPAIVDFAAMRSAVQRMGMDPAIIEPLVRADLVIDHTVTMDNTGSPASLRINGELEAARNRERYAFLKWGAQAFKTIRIIPPQTGIVHQVNLEYLAQGYLNINGLMVPDTLIGMDSHTPMANALGIVGWGVGGIEAGASMLGQPMQMLAPEVVGVELTGALREGVTATDLVLTITEMLRNYPGGVVGKFVEYIGEGCASLSLPDRATIANMSPEYGATMGFFPFDAISADYLRATGRDGDLPLAFYKAQNMAWTPGQPLPRYTDLLQLDLATVEPSVAGPKRPQDRLPLAELGNVFRKAAAEGARKPEVVNVTPMKADDAGIFAPLPERELKDGDIVIAAITACTNTSNPGLLIAAGLLARKANELGMKVPDGVKTSLAPGSPVATDFLTRAGLQQHLDALGFNTAGYGCTTCVGNSGPLAPSIEEALQNHDIIAASVLSGNRNFEGRVHPDVDTNFLMSPPLVVAMAIAGNVNIDVTTQPIGQDAKGNDVFLKDIWPSNAEITQTMHECMDPKAFRETYENALDGPETWQNLASPTGPVYDWDPDSTYIQEISFFDGFSLETPEDALNNISGARMLVMCDDNTTTDHISPVSRIRPDSPPGEYLISQGVAEGDLTSLGARRGNHHVMLRSIFGNTKARNLMLPGTTGAVTRYHPAAGEPVQMSIYDAAARYREEGRSTVVFGGKLYGTGSSRDWAAKGPALLGVRAIIAESFERIHKSNLVGMGVLPLQLPQGVTRASLNLDGSETFDLNGIDTLEPRGSVELTIHRADGSSQQIELLSRIDTSSELDQIRHKGILPMVLRDIITANT
ncbi:aconitate hydratase AcnA [Amphritea pacifica]|uniref:aconitate hydratase AcnA n=1 Tax=Amphritea pacifica TaxID=2811233 RepID=UPI0019645863|nr:aconitate hydratase AcnA [Amphritea pacifica]MBN1008587.1 aconitate hydratase AcnA [Amphritea pacifica]